MEKQERKKLGGSFAGIKKLYQSVSRASLKSSNQKENITPSTQPKLKAIPVYTISPYLQQVEFDKKDNSNPTTPLMSPIKKPPRPPLPKTTNKTYNSPNRKLDKSISNNQYSIRNLDENDELNIKLKENNQHNQQVYNQQHDKQLYINQSNHSTFLHPNDYQNNTLNSNSRDYDKETILRNQESTKAFFENTNELTRKSSFSSIYTIQPDNLSIHDFYSTKTIKRAYSVKKTNKSNEHNDTNDQNESNEREPLLEMESIKSPLPIPKLQTTYFDNPQVKEKIEAIIETLMDSNLGYKNVDGTETTACEVYHTMLDRLDSIWAERMQSLVV